LFCGWRFLAEVVIVIRVLFCVPLALTLSACMPSERVTPAKADGFQCPTPFSGSAGDQSYPKNMYWQTLSQEELVRIPEYWEMLIAHGSDSMLDNVVNFSAPGKELAGLAPAGLREKAVVANRLRAVHACAGIVADYPL
jgi:hypothetical protein